MTELSGNSTPWVNRAVIPGLVLNTRYPARLCPRREAFLPSNMAMPTNWTAVPS